MHCLIWADTYGNLENLLDFDYRTQFTHRVVGPMDESASHRLIDTRDAANFATANRAILYSMGAQPPLRSFRPFDLPPLRWVQAYLSKAKQKWERL